VSHLNETCCNENRILDRAYFIYLNTGCTDSNQNYYAALQAEIKIRKILVELDTWNIYLEQKNNNIIQNWSPSRIKPRHIRCGADRTFVNTTKIIFFILFFGPISSEYIFI
jgi:hypothetical protein